MNTPLYEWGFYVLVPLLAVVLIFGWLLYAARGKRDISLNLSGFGVSLQLTSNNKGGSAQPNE